MVIVFRKTCSVWIMLNVMEVIRQRYVILEFSDIFFLRYRSDIEFFKQHRISLFINTVL